MKKTILPRGSLQFCIEICKLVQPPGAGWFAHPWINSAELHYNPHQKDHRREWMLNTCCVTLVIYTWSIHLSLGSSGKSLCHSSQFTHVLRDIPVAKLIFLLLLSPQQDLLWNLNWGGIFEKNTPPQKKHTKDFPGVQWLRICLLMQGMSVWSLIWEDPASLGTTKPECYNYWAHALEHPVFHNKRNHCNEKTAGSKR